MLDGLKSMADWEEVLDDHDMRYFTVNLCNLFGETGTVEVRMHNGTQESRKILMWMSLWMRILKLAEGFEEIPRGSNNKQKLPLSVGPEGDVLNLLHLVAAGSDLTDALLQRRQFVLDNSWAGSPEYADLVEELYEAWNAA